ncbi:hypothetical protein BIV57_13580 [Mangrovactinospora gilvigrisea]|uniref:Uncharacterized protein n=1 Tax=Mangrovactinospora gilvigrisea TaxID=1428644 RepID=A0A1J7BEF5_9ACTN|nr:hypothetical protein [Mangrovactinospora gilvigrisea]OIV37014.1 hypothetical protein BIV57_13580 [Mangrovactinospora gilvigrisea]
MPPSESVSLRQDERLVAQVRAAVQELAHRLVDSPLDATVQTDLAQLLAAPGTHRAVALFHAWCTQRPPQELQLRTGALLRAAAVRAAQSGGGR